jgi:hypothetical protein
MFLDGHASGHLDTGSPDFPSNCWEWSEFTTSAACFSCTSPRWNLSKLKPHAVKATKSKLRNPLLFLKTKIPRPLPQATTSNHSNVFTSILFLPKGRTGEAWKPTNKTVLCQLPRIEHISFSITFPSHVLCYYYFWRHLSHNNTTFTSDCRRGLDW